MQKRLLALLLLFAFTQINAQKKEWISLFDGKTTSGWHTYGKDAVGEAWKVIDGALMLDPTNKQGWQIKGGGDIVTNESYGDFHLQLEWKISKKGNSGIIFFVQDEPKKYNYIWYTGPEMQVLDNDGHADAKINKHRAGNLYDLVAGVEGAVKPVGEWNLVDIINEKGTLTLKLNGVTTVTTTLGDDAWKNLIKNSKFSKGESPDFGKVFTGHIGLQDHGDQVWYRNIRIQRL
ncbi:MAG: 3-keto-disaccharide hydrolase [Sediminibacterium sp.]